MQKRNWGCQVCAWASETKMSTNIALMHEKQMIHSSHLTSLLIRPVGPLCRPRILARVPLSAPTVGHAVHAEGLVVRTSYRVPVFILHVYHVYLAAHRMLNHACYSWQTYMHISSEPHANGHIMLSPGSASRLNVDVHACVRT